MNNQFDPKFNKFQKYCQFYIKTKKTSISTLFLWAIEKWTKQNISRDWTLLQGFVGLQNLSGLDPQHALFLLQQNANGTRNEEVE